ncbi:MAG: hypothetical protein KDB16_04745 [Acidimicrobiales bacterium]|nr:hypothetical protein [Acidimicrobiales bacterium]
MFGLNRRVVALLMLLFVSITACTSSADADSTGDGGETQPTESQNDSQTATTDSDSPDGAARTDDTAAPVENNEPVADGTVLEDPDGIYDDTSIEEVIALCSGEGVNEACGQLGMRLADVDTMTDTDLKAARCTAAQYLAAGQTERFGAVITLSVIAGDSDAPGVNEALESLRAASADPEQLDAAAAHVAAWASEGC